MAAKKPMFTFHKGFNSTTFNVRHGQAHLGSISRNPNGTWRHSMMSIMEIASLQSPYKTREAAAKALRRAVMDDSNDTRRRAYAEYLTAPTGPDA